MGNPFHPKESHRLRRSERSLDELGVLEANELLQVEAADIAEIAAFLKKIPQGRLLKIYNDAAASA